MRMLHGSIAEGAIVQVQQKAHVSGNRKGQNARFDKNRGLET
jgi:hypothetical protein